MLVEHASVASGSAVRAAGLPARSAIVSARKRERDRFVELHFVCDWQCPGWVSRFCSDIRNLPIQMLRGSRSHEKCLVSHLCAICIVNNTRDLPSNYICTPLSRRQGF